MLRVDFEHRNHTFSLDLTVLTSAPDIFRDSKISRKKRNYTQARRSRHELNR